MDVMTVNDATTTRQIRILAGSADQDTLERLGRGLRDDRHRVVSTRRAGRLLLRALENRFDLAVVDLELEDLEGVEAVQILRRARPDVPVIVLADGLSERARRQLAAEGVVRFLRKPVGYEDLRQSVMCELDEADGNTPHDDRELSDVKNF